MNMLILIVVTVTFIFEIFIFSRITLFLRRYSIKRQYSAALEPPSVSVCIPARNERHAMTKCLETVLASDYKKMEVLVFDDNSDDSTSTLIKSFAHDGVRFIPGAPLEGNWLGRNHALEVLSREASGTYIIFMSVDAVIEPTTISKLVGYVSTENAKMVSVLPRRHDMPRANALFGYLRYFWEIIFSGPSKPAVGAALWLIDRTTLIKDSGGFASIRNIVVPERSLALRLGDEYRCLISDADLGVGYEKRWHSQFETAKRLLFPALRQSALRSIGAIIALLLLASPIFVVITGIVFADWSIVILALVSFVFGGFSYVLYAKRAWSSLWWLALFIWPYALLQEAVFILLSWIGYARGTITWKGRSVISPSSSEA